MRKVQTIYLSCIVTAIVASVDVDTTTTTTGAKITLAPKWRGGDDAVYTSFRSALRLSLTAQGPAIRLSQQTVRLKV
jgi:hypothetical protein